MLNLKALLTKICQSLVVSSGTATITTTTGTLNSAPYTKVGHVVFLTIQVQNGSAVSNGNNLYAGTLTSTDLKPSLGVTTSGYYDKYNMSAYMTSDGTITVRNCSNNSFAKNQAVNLGFIYIV